MDNNNNITFIMERIDGLGSRLIALMNAFFLAEYTEYNKVKFIWRKNRPFKNTKTEDTKTGFRRENSGKVEIVGLCVEDKDVIFSQQFLYQYHMDNIDGRIINFDKSYGSLEEFKNYLKLNPNVFFNVPLTDLFFRKYLRNLDPIFYRNKMSLIWNKIEFSDNIKRVIAIANNVAQECGDFVCIHIRSGDAIYDYADFRKFNTQQFYHVTSAELAMGIIDSIDNSKKIILVGDDLRTLEVIADYYSKDRIATINSFRDPTQMSNLELFFFDVIFMSKATLLYGTHSAVIRLANFIGNQTFFNNYNVFTDQEYYFILKKYFPILNLHPSQKAYSLFSLFVIGKKLDEPYSSLINYLEKALHYDYDNDKYRVHIVDCLLREGKIYEADNYIKKIFIELSRGQLYLDTILLKGWEGIVFSEVFDNYFKFASEKYPYISFIASKIYAFQENIEKSFYYITLAMQCKDNQNFKNYYEYIQQKYNKLYNIKHALYYKDIALRYKEKWNWDKAVKYYKMSLKYSDDYLVEFLDFLANIGQLKLLNQILFKYSYERIEKEVSSRENYHVISAYLELYKNDIMKKKNVICDNLHPIDVLINIVKKEKISQEEELIATYCISSCDIFFSEELDISVYLSLYRKIWDKNLIRSQFLITKLVKSYKKYIVKNLDILIQVTSDIIALGNIKNKLQPGAKKYQEKLLSYYKLHHQKNIKPKIAVCLWGIYRGKCEKNLEFLKKNIIEPLGADVFVHLWNKWDLWNGYGRDVVWTRRYLRRKDWNLFPPEISCYDTLEKFFPNVLNKLSTPVVKTLPLDVIKSILSPLLVQVDDDVDFKNKFSFSLEKLSYMPFANYNPHAIARLRYGMYQSYNLAKEYGKQYGEYDYIILARIDQAYLGKINTQQLLSLSKNEFMCTILKHGIDDKIIAGSKKTISKFVNKYNIMVKKQNTNFYQADKRESYYIKGEEGVNFLWSVENNIRPIPINLDIDILLSTQGMIPNFYDELKKDLNSSAIAFKDKIEYKELLNFLQFDDGKFFKKYDQNLEKENLKIGAVERIHNHLSYKIGCAVLSNMSSMINIIKLPIALYRIKKNHNLDKRLINNSLQSMPIEQYSDHAEALKEKESLEYKIGEIVIKSHKKWYKGGYIKMFFDIYQLKNQIKHKDK
ncbi:hypothetical protein I11999_03380 [Campylobacter coli]|uniref:hypothetical protein n=1 Tax=Campylobacter coli TaxID=195 RepID=UPI002866D2A4|nr:hypothetical protein [Campylobacter coli]BEK52567.1 hypothetical protein I11999_03380 [Campylobacter coli]HDV6384717.1 hypothetical protein [Campylobacter coli]